MKKVILLIILAILAFADLPGYAEKLYFYTGKKYGTEYLYSPLNLLLNAGFDIYQCREGEERDVFMFPYDIAIKNVLNNLGNPARSIERYGLKNFIIEEVFPLTFNENARWWPNYQLHLIGGGATFAYLHDYFSYRGFENPAFYAVVTYYAYHLTNEVIENNYFRNYSTDAVADIYIFDLAGIFLFLSPKVRRFFSVTMNMADWSMQPMFIGQDYYLENNGQYFSLKWLIPIKTNKHWHIFYYWGLNFVLGLSYKFNNGYALSFGAGIRSKRIRVQDLFTNKSTITYVYTGGIFLDLHNSLLASVIVNVNYYEALQINVYPGVLVYKEFSPGLYLAVSQDSSFKFGILFNHPLTESLYNHKQDLVNDKKLRKFNSSYI